MEDTEKLNKLYDKYSRKFRGTDFHNLLWQLIINKKRSGGKSALTFAYTDCGQQIGIADKGEKGYTTTATIFKENVTHDQAVKICNDLNKKIFNLEPLQVAKIVLSTL